MKHASGTSLLGGWGGGVVDLKGLMGADVTVQGLGLMGHKGVGWPQGFIMVPQP